MFNLEKDESAQIQSDKISVIVTWENPSLIKKIKSMIFDSDKIDLDAKVRCHYKSGSMETISYSNLSGVNGAIVHHGDDLTGANGGERIDIDLKQCAKAGVESLSIILDIYEGVHRNQYFKDVDFMQVKIIDNNNDILQFKMSDDFKNSTTIQLGTIYIKSDTYYNFIANPKELSF